MANEVLLQESPTRSHPPIANALYIAAALIISGAILFSFAAVNGQLFRALNALLPVQNLWLPLSAIGDGLSVGCLLYILFRARSDILAAALIAGLMAACR